MRPRRMAFMGSLRGMAVRLEPEGVCFYTRQGSIPVFAQPPELFDSKTLAEIRRGRVRADIGLPDSAQCRLLRLFDAEGTISQVQVRLHI